MSSIQDIFLRFYALYVPRFPSLCSSEFGFTLREPLEYLSFIVHLLSLIVSIVV
jgi:hypothetical protein